MFTLKRHTETAAVKTKPITSFKKTAGPTPTFLPCDLKKKKKASTFLTIVIWECLMFYFFPSSQLWNFRDWLIWKTI